MVALALLLTAKVIFMEPAGKVDAGSAEIHEKMPLYRVVAGAEKYESWLKNEPAGRALRLYGQAAAIAAPGGSAPDYYVALVPGGNHAAAGFRLRTAAGIEEFPHRPYILLDADPWRFETTLLHETGHAVMMLLNGGREMDAMETSSIPHSTATLTDRTTAFREGWAIHLETLAAHQAREAGLRRQYHRESIAFGDAPYRESEFYRHAADLTSYSQNLSRYLDVRENAFAFDSAFKGPDYLRAQLDPARDYASLRDADQLLQSEGFYASFFFLFVIRGADASEDMIRAREDRLMRAMAATFARVKAGPSTPWLPELVSDYMHLFPEDRTAMADALNDLSHGVFVDPAAAAMWREHYLAALRLDLAGLKRDAMQAARKRWRELVLADSRVLFSRLGPQLPAAAPAVSVRLAAFGESAPLRFDLNTAQEGVLRLIPGITDGEVARWLGERAKKPFAGAADFRERVKLSGAALAGMKFQ
jgi:hypothetical protein